MTKQIEKLTLGSSVLLLALLGLAADLYAVQWFWSWKLLPDALEPAFRATLANLTIFAIGCVVMERLASRWRIACALGALVPAAASGVEPDEDPILKRIRLHSLSLMALLLLLLTVGLSTGVTQWFLDLDIVPDALEPILWMMVANFASLATVLGAIVVGTMNRRLEAAKPHMTVEQLREAVFRRTDWPGHKPSCLLSTKWMYTSFLLVLSVFSMAFLIIGVGLAWFSNMGRAFVMASVPFVWLAYVISFPLMAYYRHGAFRRLLASEAEMFSRQLSDRGVPEEDRQSSVDERNVLRQIGVGVLVAFLVALTLMGFTTALIVDAEYRTFRGEVQQLRRATQSQADVSTGGLNGNVDGSAQPFRFPLVSSVATNFVALNERLEQYQEERTNVARLVLAVQTLFRGDMGEAKTRFESLIQVYPQLARAGVEYCGALLVDRSRAPYDKNDLCRAHMMYLRGDYVAAARAYKGILDRARGGGGGKTQNVDYVSEPLEAFELCLGKLSAVADAQIRNRFLSTPANSCAMNTLTDMQALSPNSPAVMNLKARIGASYAELTAATIEKKDYRNAAQYLLRAKEIIGTTPQVRELETRLQTLTPRER